MPLDPGYNAFQFGQGPPPKRPRLEGLAPAPTPTPLHLQRPGGTFPVPPPRPFDAYDRRAAFRRAREARRPSDPFGNVFHTEDLNRELFRPGRLFDSDGRIEPAKRYVKDQPVSAVWDQANIWPPDFKEHHHLMFEESDGKEKSGPKSIEEQIKMGDRERISKRELQMYDWHQRYPILNKRNDAERMTDEQYSSWRREQKPYMDAELRREIIYDRKRKDIH